ncbi:MAG: type IV secretion system protein [Acidobacteria bacterium]|nr:type IV secretion system protein [Acidobacteriota bacterium]
MQFTPGVAPTRPDGVKEALDSILNDITADGIPPMLAEGWKLWLGLTLIVFVWKGTQMAFSGTFDMGVVIRMIFGVAIPATMLYYYSTPLPGTTRTFPGIVVAQGGWIQERLATDATKAAPQALSEAIRHQSTQIKANWQAENIWDLLFSTVDLIWTLFVGTAITAFTLLFLALLWCITMAQVIWAQIAIAILIVLGPILIPWLVFEPMAFLFWGWFKGLIVYSLYGAVAGAIMSVFVGVGVLYLQGLTGATPIPPSLEGQFMWGLAVLLLSLAGILASFKVGEISALIVSGSGATGSGLMGMAMMAATGGKAVLAKAASGGGGGKMLKGK